MPYGLLALADISVCLGLAGLAGCVIGYGIARLSQPRIPTPAPSLKPTLHQAPRELMPRKMVHSIKNALVPIRLYPDLVKRNLQRPEKARDIVDKMIAASSKAYGRFEDFNLIFGGTECEETTTPAPAERIQHMLDTEGFQHEFPNTTIAFQNNGDTAIAVPPRSFERLAVNLIQNACLAVQDQAPGRVTVATRQLPDGRFELAVSDTGKCPPHEVLHYIDQCGNAPTALSPAVGMGLTLVATITRNGHGTLSPSSSPDGFTLRVQFPPLARA